MSISNKYGGLEIGSPEHSRAKYFCRKYNMSYEEYTTNPPLNRGGKKVPTDPDELKRYYKSSYLKHKYGITLEQRESMLAEQNSRCWICSCKIDEKNMATDHCHSTGRVRGMLCTQCNFGIGNFKDSPKLLRKAAKYLEN